MRTRTRHPRRRADLAELALQNLVELHFRDCPGRCRGRGWTSAPGIGKNAFPCVETSRIVRVTYAEWKRRGCPAHAEQTVASLS